MMSLNLIFRMMLTSIISGSERGRREEEAAAGAGVILYDFFGILSMRVERFWDLGLFVIWDFK